MSETSVVNQLYISVRGVVQGVGFRPFIYQLATRYNLKGWVCNTSEDVRIEIEGDAEKVLVKLKKNRYGHNAAVIGEVVKDYPKRVVMKTRLGASIILDMLVDELLPRIC